MSNKVSNWMAHQFQQWASKKRADSNLQSLTSNRIYILPSAFGWLYGFVILTLATGAVNYQLNAAYFLIFLLIVIGLLAMVQTQQNIKGIEIECTQIEDVEQGKPAKMVIVIHAKMQTRYGLFFSYKSGEYIYKETISKQGGNAIVPIETPSRGQFKAPIIKLYSFFPLGLFSVWTYLNFDLTYFVYPAAVSPGFWPSPMSQDTLEKSRMYSPGEEEQHDLQSVDNPWIQASHIAWKQSARDQAWYLKKMINPRSPYWLFSLDELDQNQIESALQHMSFWVQSAEQQKQPYALKLKENSTPFGLDREHMKYCLRQLAVY